MECWMDIEGFEGLYRVNKLGDVMSVARFDTYLRQGVLVKRFRKTKILKPKIDRYGYKVVCLRRDNENHHKTVHRLVACTFITNTKGNPVVNHKDGNKQNNNVTNLEFVTVQENTKHAYDNGLFTLGRDEKGRWC